MNEALVRVVAPHFVAGAIFLPQNGQWTCTEAAPIIKWMIGKTDKEIKTYCTKKNWTATKVKEHE